MHTETAVLSQQISASPQRGQVAKLRDREALSHARGTHPRSHHTSQRNDGRRRFDLRVGPPPRARVLERAREQRSRRPRSDRDREARHLVRRVPPRGRRRQVRARVVRARVVALALPLDPSARSTPLSRSPRPRSSSPLRRPPSHPSPSPSPSSSSRREQRERRGGDPPARGGPPVRHDRVRRDVRQRR